MKKIVRRFVGRRIGREGVHLQVRQKSSRNMLVVRSMSIRLNESTDLRAIYRSHMAIFTYVSDDAVCSIYHSIRHKQSEFAQPIDEHRNDLPEHPEKAVNECNSTNIRISGGTIRGP